MIRSRRPPVRRSASTGVLKAYQAAKEVTLRRLYLDTMTDILTHSQPLVIDDKLGTGSVPAAQSTINSTGPASFAQRIVATVGRNTFGGGHLALAWYRS